VSIKRAALILRSMRLIYGSTSLKLILKALPVSNGINPTDDSN